MKNFKFLQKFSLWIKNQNKVFLLWPVFLNKKIICDNISSFICFEIAGLLYFEAFDDVYNVDMSNFLMVFPKV